MKGISMTGCILHGGNKKKNQDLKLKPCLTHCITEQREGFRLQGKKD